MLKGLQYPESRNPYTGLWRASMLRHGVAFDVAIRPSDLLIASLSLREYDIVHLHWVHPVSSNLATSVIKFGLLHISLSLFVLRGTKIYWTVHNVLSHERKYMLLDKLNNFLVSRFAEGIFVHGKSLVEEIKQCFKIKKNIVFYIPHGNYSELTDSYLMSTKDSLRINRDQGIRNFLHFGNLRGYKGLFKLVEVFYELGELPASLKIVGKPYDKVVETEIKKAASADSRINLFLDYLSDDHLIRLASDADVIVLPFERVDTSGSLVLALTLGKPVILPYIDSLADYVGEDCAFLYSISDPTGLRDAISEASSCDVKILREKGVAAMKRANNLNWDDIGKYIVSVYSLKVPLKN